MTSLETRYRWLLVSYPREFRKEYGDEMLGVMMESARTGQRFSAFRVTIDVLKAGVLTRILGSGAVAQKPRHPFPGRRDAAAVTAMLTTLVLMVSSFRLLFWQTSWISSPDELQYGDASSFYTFTDAAVRGTGWLLVAIALAASWRRSAFVLALVASLTEIVSLAVNDGTAWRWVGKGWVLVTIPVLLALSAKALNARRLTTILGRRGVALLAAGVVLGGMSGGFPYVVPGTGLRGGITVLLLVVAAILLLLVSRRTDAVTRRNLATPLATLAVILIAQPLLEQAVGMHTQRALTWSATLVEVAMLVGLPLLVFLTMSALQAVSPRQSEQP